MDEWVDVWRAVGFDLAVQRLDEGRGGIHRVLAAGGRPGAVVVAVDSGRVLMVSHLRPAIGTTLWEFPRGFGDPADRDGRATGARELREETGVETTDVLSLGPVWPDSGLLGNAVDVVVCRVQDAETTAGDGEVVASAWLSADEVRDRIRDGQVRDGITLAAWALVCSQEDPSILTGEDGDPGE